VDQRLLRALLTSLVKMPETAAELKVSERDWKILDAIRRGMSNKEIGAQLDLTEPAVKAGVQRLFHRFGVRRRAELVAASQSPKDLGVSS
jgi:DNA-binding NarL/FixJ family response regulator